MIGALLYVLSLPWLPAGRPGSGATHAGSSGPGTPTLLGLDALIYRSLGAGRGHVGPGGIRQASSGDPG